MPLLRGLEFDLYKGMLNQLESDRPGAKINFYLAFLQAKKNGLFTLQAGPEDQNLHACPNCGQPTSSPDECSFCRMFAERPSSPWVSTFPYSPSIGKSSHLQVALDFPVGHLHARLFNLGPLGPAEGLEDHRAQSIFEQRVAIQLAQGFASEPGSSRIFSAGALRGSGDRH